MSSGETPPNVVLITVDALRVDHLGYVDSEYSVETPCIDEFFRTSVNYPKAFSNAPHTRASFPAILTGTYPWDFGGYDAVSPSRPHIAECFQKAGYDTAGFHSNPYLSAEFNYDRGFESFSESKSSPSLFARLRKSLTKRFSGDRKDTFVYRLLEKAHNMGEYVLGRNIGVPYVSGEQLNETVDDYLASADEPVFAWMHYMDPHDPYLPKSGTVSEGMSERRAIRLQRKMSERHKTLETGEVDALKRLYRGEIEYLDACVGEMLDSIERRLEGDACILFTADHGEAFGEHGYFRHPHEFHNELVRVPFILSRPGDRDVSRDEVVSSVDILPTLLNVADIEPPAAVAGQSLFALDDQDRTVIGETGEPLSGKVMATDGEYKAVADLPARKYEAYRSVTLTEESPCSTSLEEVRALYNELEERIDSVGETEHVKMESPEIGSATEERLYQLGYKE